MKKIWFASIFMVLFALTLAGCSGGDEEDNDSNQEEEDAEEVAAEETENEEVESEQEDAMEEETEEDEVTEEEEETFADEVRVFDIETVLLDQEEVSDFNTEDEIFIEHDELLYVEHEFITELMDYELTYDEENTLAEVFEQKGDFEYQPVHEDEGGAVMELGQVYSGETDEYTHIEGESHLYYKFIEYDGKLFVPERLIAVQMDAPVNHLRRDQTVEFGLASETTNIYDFGVEGQYSSPSAEVTQDAADVTIDGENNEKGIIIRDVNSANKFAGIYSDYNFSEISGFLYNKSDENTVEVKLQYNEDQTIETVNLEPGQTHDFEHNLKGEVIFYVLAKGAAGSSSEVVVVGELR